MLNKTILFTEHEICSKGQFAKSYFISNSACLIMSKLLKYNIPTNSRHNSSRYVLFNFFNRSNNYNTL